MTTDEEARLEILKIATRADMCDSDADRAVKIAQKLLEFLRPNRGGADPSPAARSEP